MTSTLIAQQDAAKTAGAEPGLFNPMTMMMVVFGLLFLVVILPAQRRQQREQQQMLSNLKRGSRVVTSGGILGTVDNMKDNEDEITLRSGDTKLKVLKSSVTRVLGQDEAEAKA